MKLKSIELVISAMSKTQYPHDGLPEVAFVGRSNVGKSSAINTLLNRRSLARVSQNQELLIFTKSMKNSTLLICQAMGMQKLLKQNVNTGER